MAVVADLLVRMGVDSAELRKGLKTVQSDLQRFTRDVGAMKSALEGAFAVAGIGAAAKGLADLVMSGTRAADQIGKMAQSAGVSVEMLSSLAYAARLSDVSTEDLGIALGKLSKSMAGAADGTGAQADAFRALGVSVKQSDGSLRNAGDVLSDIADRFAGAEDGAEKTALAIEIFGKSGARLIPLLNGGAAGLRSLSEEAKTFGIAIDEQAAKSAEQFNDNLERMKMGLEGLGLQIGTRINGALANLSNSFLETATAAGGISDAAAVIVGALKAIGTAAVGAWGGLQMFAAHAAAPIAALAFAVQGKFAEAGQALRNWRGSVEEEAQRTKDRVNAIWGNGLSGTLTKTGGPPKAKLKLPSKPDDSAEKARAKKLAEEMKDFNRVVAEAEKVMDSVATPTEKYFETLRDLDNLLGAGAIDQEIYARAVKKAADEFFEASGGADQLKESMKAFNAVVDDAERVMDDVATPLEKYRQEMEKLQALLNAGAISQDQFVAASDRAAMALGQSNVAIAGMADAGVDAYKSIVDAARNSTSIIDALWQSLLKSFQNIIDQMVAKWIESQILMAGAGALTGGGGGVAFAGLGETADVGGFMSLESSSMGLSAPTASVAQASTAASAGSTSITVVTPDASATARYVNGQDFSRALRQQQRKARRRGTV